MSVTAGHLPNIYLPSSLLTKPKFGDVMSPAEIIIFSSLYFSKNWAWNTAQANET